MQMIKEGSLDKAPRLSIRIVIWILPSDTVFVNSIKISANTETAMLSTQGWPGAEVEEGEEDQAVGRTR